MKKNILIAVIVALIIIAGGIYYWTMPKAGGNSASSAEAKAVLAKLATHMVLPTGEDPQIGRIDDPAQAAKAQPFVAGAVPGDLLIVYVKAAKAIVYSPSRDLIINVGPVSMNPEAGANKTPAPVTSTTTTKAPTKK